MSQYTSTREGFEQAMHDSLTLPTPEETKAFGEAFAAENAYHIVNGSRQPRDTWIQDMQNWTKVVSDSKREIKQFLLHEGHLSARLVGTCKVSGVPNSYESLLLGKVEPKSGRLECLIEHCVWAPVGEEMKEGRRMTGPELKEDVVVRV